MNFSAFIKECHKKEVIKMLSIYIVSSWVLIQVLSVVWQPLGLPEISITILILVLLIGLPIYIFYIWKFHLQKFEGEPVDLDGDGIIDKSIFHRMYFSFLALISMFVAVIVVFIIQNNFGTRDLPGFGDENKIAVLKFGNNTGDAKFDMVSKMTTDWIVHGITEKRIAQVISPEIVEDYTNILKASTASFVDRNVLNDYFKPEKVVSGNFYLKGDKLLFQSSVTDGSMNETFISFQPVECDSDSPLDCIENLKQIILGHLIAEEQKANNLNLQDEAVPPKFDAYQYLLEAKSYSSDTEIYLELLNKAIEADSNYFEPKVLRISYYYNRGEFKTADSILKTMTDYSKSNDRQKNLLDFHAALLSGRNDEIHRTGVYEYNYAPLDWDSNSTSMVTSWQFVYQPKGVDSIFEMIPMKGMDVANCADCADRYYVKAWADIELKRYSKVIDLLNPFSEGVSHVFLKKPLITAYIKNGDIQVADEILGRFELATEPEIWKELFIYEGKMFLLVGEEDKANEYFNKIIETEATEKTMVYHADALYYMKDYAKAEEVLEEIYKKDPKNSDALTKLAISKLKNNKPEEATSFINQLDNLREEYQFGAIDYRWALYYAALNDINKVRRHLYHAVAAGKRYHANNFQNDPELASYFNSDSFKSLLKFWH